MPWCLRTTASKIVGCTRPTPRVSQASGTSVHHVCGTSGTPILPQRVIPVKPPLNPVYHTFVCHDILGRDCIDHTSA